MAHAPGIYFGLDEMLYHADPALGSGSVRKLAKNPIYYWIDSPMNPLREADFDTPALIYGRALHKLVLEGVEAFGKAYRTEPVAADYPECLVTATDLKGALKALGQKVSGTKPELIERLRAADPGAKIYDDIVAAFEAECAKSGATKLKRAVYERVVAAAGFIAADERLKTAFRGGRPEVSVFWEQHGVPLKMRIDYLRLGAGPNGPIGLITDLKSYANQNEAPPERAVVSSVASTRLDLQAVHYIRGAHEIAGFIRGGKVFGAAGINAEWLAALQKVSEWQFWWAFYEKDAPIALLRQAGQDLLAGAEGEWWRALQSYRENMEAFGTEWRFVDPMLEPVVSLADLPKWLSAAA